MTWPVFRLKRKHCCAGAERQRTLCSGMETERVHVLLLRCVFEMWRPVPHAFARRGGYVRGRLLGWQVRVLQWFSCSRNIGQITPKNIDFIIGQSYLFLNLNKLLFWKGLTVSLNYRKIRFSWIPVSGSEDSSSLSRMSLSKRINPQSIGEPGAQSTMRTFHTGGVFSGEVSVLWANGYKCLIVKIIIFGATKLVSRLEKLHWLWCVCMPGGMHTFQSDLADISALTNNTIRHSRYQTVDVYQGDLRDVSARWHRQIAGRLDESEAVLRFEPKHRLGHPNKYLFLLSKNLFTGSKYPRINWFNFEKNFTDLKWWQVTLSTRLRYENYRDDLILWIRIPLDSKSK